MTGTESPDTLCRITPKELKRRQRLRAALAAKLTADNATTDVNSSSTKDLSLEGNQYTKERLLLQHQYQQRVSRSSWYRSVSTGDLPSFTSLNSDNSNDAITVSGMKRSNPFSGGSNNRGSSEHKTLRRKPSIDYHAISAIVNSNVDDENIDAEHLPKYGCNTTNINNDVKENTIGHGTDKYQVDKVRSFPTSLRSSEIRSSSTFLFGLCTSTVLADDSLDGTLGSTEHYEQSPSSNRSNNIYEGDRGTSSPACNDTEFSDEELFVKPCYTKVSTTAPLNRNDALGAKLMDVHSVVMSTPSRGLKMRSRLRPTILEASVEEAKERKSPTQVSRETHCVLLPPVDWTIYSGVSFSSSSTFSWCNLSTHGIRSSDQVVGMAKFARCSVAPLLHKAGVSSDSSTSSDAVTDDFNPTVDRSLACRAFHQATMYFVHPSRPIAPVALAAGVSARDTVAARRSADETASMIMLEDILQDWRDAFRSAYTSMRAGSCGCVYVVTELYTLLFCSGSLSTTCADSDEDDFASGGTGVPCAIVSRSTPGLRALLRREGVPFVLLEAPQLHDDANSDVLSEMAEATRVGAGIQFHVTSRTKGLDGRSRSVLYTRGQDGVHGLYNFALNHVLMPTQTSGSPLPHIFAPIAFRNGTLKSVPVCVNGTRQRPARGANGRPLSASDTASMALERVFSLDFTGPMFPWNIAALTELLKWTQHGEFDAELLADEICTSLNVRPSSHLSWHKLLSTNNGDYDVPEEEEKDGEIMWNTGQTLKDMTSLPFSFEVYMSRKPSLGLCSLRRLICRSGYYDWDKREPF